MTAIMSTIKVENLSSFGQLAVNLDNEFSELSRLSSELERQELQSDSGLERAIKLLKHFTVHGQNITEGIQEFSRSLQEAREKSELAARSVSERAILVQQRKQEQDQLLEKLGQLGEKVKEVTKTLSAVDQTQIPEHLPALDTHLQDFMSQAHTIQEEARMRRLRGVERDAQSLFGSLESARRKLSTVQSKLN
jgi:chromosome segregation ATPase